jgi:hydroxymethylpyrimidine pyrophosphatase-like HAD family hydrolase
LKGIEMDTSEKLLRITDVSKKTTLAIGDGANDVNMIL